MLPFELVIVLGILLISIGLSLTAGPKFKNAVHEVMRKDYKDE